VDGSVALVQTSVTANTGGLFPAAAADVGGVGRPAPGGRLLPLDSDPDVKPERPGEDRGEDFDREGEVHQRAAGRYVRDTALINC
jgi:hypothetical protein